MVPIAVVHGAHKHDRCDLGWKVCLSCPTLQFLARQDLRDKQIFFFVVVVLFSMFVFPNVENTGDLYLYIKYIPQMYAKLVYRYTRVYLESMVKIRVGMCVWSAC